MLAKRCSSGALPTSACGHVDCCARGMTNLLRRHRSHESTALSVAIGALAVVLPSVAYAKTLYVDAAAGDDSVSYANNSAATPWSTIGRAAWGSTARSSPNASEAAQAGDVVIISAGTYTTQGMNERWE